MKKLFIVGNWKSYKTTSEAKDWLYKFALSYEPKENINIVICPPFTLLSYVHAYIEANNLPLAIGAQNVSAYPQGAHTGEIAAQQLKEFVSFVIVGHSETRKAFSFSESTLENQVEEALKSGLEVIYCVSNSNAKIPPGVKIVAYEPLSAIGSGHPDKLSHVDKVAADIKSRHDVVVLYGGSVDKDEIVGFISLKNINGVLCGGASLDPSTFLELIFNA